MTEPQSSDESASGISSVAGGQDEEAPCAHGNIAEDCVLCDLESLIDALPTLAEIAAMDTDEQNEVYAQASDLCDIYYDDLTDEEQGQVSNIDVLWEILDYFSSGIMLAADEEHDHSYENGFCSICGTYQPAVYDSAGDVYEISNAGQLFWFAALVNGTTTIKVNENEVALENISAADADANGRLATNIEIPDGYTWTPIGNYDMDKYEGSKYDGTFDGQNHSISGLYINTSAADCPQGLFGYIENGGTVQNVTVVGTVTGSYAGGVAGYNDGTVTDCTGNVTVSGSTFVGGVVGVNNGTMSGCSNTAAITGTGTGSTVGGAVGQNSGKMSDCTNSGTVSGSYSVGGIVGNNDTNSVSGCANSGTVTCTSTSNNASAGGVIGYNYGGTITSCTNDAGVSGGQYTGGMVGRNYYGTVSGCTNSADVTGSSSDYVGGVVGLNYTSTVRDSSNLGNVTGGTGSGSYAGGVVGRNYYDIGSGSSTVTGCYNVGTVTGTSAGLVAGYNCSAISNCCYLGDTESISIGSNDNGNVSSLIYAGTADFASGKVAWLLNGKSSNDEDIIWYQNLDNGETADAYPVTDSTHGTVYCGTNCAGNTVYSNMKLSAANHQYDDCGFCRYCGAYEPADTDSDGVYQIENAGNLYWFAALVMGDTSQENITEKVPNANAVLLCDIDLNVTTDTHTNTLWTPIGDYYTSQYSGTFDGSGYTVSGLYIHNTSGYYQGLFGYVNGGTVKNVTVDGNVTGAYSVGGIVGQVTNGGTITGCVNHADVTAIGNRVGGIVGYSDGTISNCANTGALSGGDAYGYVGGIAGSLNTTNGGASSCYSVGTVSGDGTYIGGIAGYLGENATMDNCYYLDTVASAAIGSVKGSTTYTEAKTSAAFASGEVAWLLQSGQSSQITLIWGQDLTGNTIDTDDDSYPVLNRTNDEYTLRVVQISFYYLLNTTADSVPFAYGYTNYAKALADYPSETGATYTYYTYNGESYTKHSTSRSFGDDEKVYVEATYTISQTLSDNVYSDNDTDSASRGSSYSATLTVSDGYSMSVTVTMGGEDITGTACPDGSTVNIGSVTGAVTITAVATAIDYTVSYDANGGTGTMADSTFSGSGSVTLENGFTCTGHTFSGWNTAADGSGTDYETGASLRASDFSGRTSLTLYAQWTTDTYTVTCALTYVTTDNTATSAVYGSEYSSALTADTGYTIKNVTVRMGGADVSDTVYSDGVIRISDVTGDIVITADAVKSTTAVTGVRLNNSSISLAEGASVTLTATISPSDATEQTVTWSSSDKTIATVDANGRVTAVSSGTATITATTLDGGYTAVCSVTVTAPDAKTETGKTAVTVTADDVTRAYGSANPSFTFTITEGTLADGDTEDDLGVTLSTTATKDSAAGTYAITGTSDSAKYDVTVVEGTLTVVNLTELPEQDFPDADAAHMVVMQEGLTEVPETLRGNPELNTVEKIEAMLKTIVTQQDGYTEENSAVYEVALMISFDGGLTWEKATEENFPSNGLKVLLTYPDGTGKDTHDFVVTHMFTSDAFGKTPGDTETPTVAKTDNGIQVTVTGLSPIAIAWEELETETAAETETGTTTKTDTGPEAETAPDAETAATTKAETATETETAAPTEAETTTETETAATTEAETTAETETVAETAATTETAVGTEIETETEISTAAATGDTSDLLMWFLILCISAGALVFAAAFYEMNKRKA
ncbi:MAG: Ig-like domain-containing protein [Lachnospiraceae bacterium]|nr:Ig-like domain-containing protein [Lachnospiraceae bacterium]